MIPCIRIVYVGWTWGTEGIIVTWLVRVYAVDIKLKSQQGEEGMRLDKRGVRFVNCLWNGKGCGVHAVAIDFGQGLEFEVQGKDKRVRRSEQRATHLRIYRRCLLLFHSRIKCQVLNYLSPRALEPPCPLDLPLISDHVLSLIFTGYVPYCRFRLEIVCMACNSVVGWSYMLICIYYN